MRSISFSNVRYQNLYLFNSFNLSFYVNVHSIVVSTFIDERDHCRGAALPPHTMGTKLGLVATVQGMARCHDLLPRLKPLSRYRSTGTSGARIFTLRASALLCKSVYCLEPACLLLTATWDVICTIATRCGLPNYHSTRCSVLVHLECLPS